MTDKYKNTILKVVPIVNGVLGIIPETLAKKFKEDDNKQKKLIKSVRKTVSDDSLLPALQGLTSNNRAGWRENAVCIRTIFFFFLGV